MNRVSIRFDEWELLQAPLELMRDGRIVRLQELPLRILDALVAQPGQLVTREELISRLWPKGVVEFDAGMNTAVHKLRAALEDDAESPRYIETIPRKGYRFVGTLRQDAPATALVPDSSARTSFRRWWFIAAAAVLAAAGLIAWGLATQRSARSAEAIELWQRGVIAWQNGAAAPGRPFEEIRRVEDLYTRALQLDPDLADAYADRARVRVQVYVSGVDVGETNIEAARADIAAARRLVGDSPKVLMRETVFTWLLDNDVDGALALLRRAESIRALGPDELMSKSNLLGAAGQNEEADAIAAQAAKLEPNSAAIHDFWMRNLLSTRRFERAMEVAEGFDRRVPGVLQRGEAVFDFTGSTTRWRAESELRKGVDASLRLSNEIDLLRFEGHSNEALALLDGNGTFRQQHVLGSLNGSTALPIAELRGWLHLQLGDAAAAARDGEAVALFLQSQPERTRGAWWPHLLAAEGALFRGDHSLATREARRVLQEVEAASNVASRVHARARVARILAWVGENAAAMELLEALSGPDNCLGPAAIARDPLYFMPLAADLRFRALLQRLEAEIRTIT